jgi:hypothetical protein
MRLVHQNVSQETLPQNLQRKVNSVVRKVLLGNAVMNISSSKNIPSIRQNGTLRIIASQPANLVGLQMVSKRTVTTPMRTVPPSQVPILQEDQSHPRNTVQNLHGWTVVSY